MESFKGKSDAEIRTQIGILANSGITEDVILLAIKRDGIDVAEYKDQVELACQIKASFSEKDKKRKRRGGLTNFDIYKYIDRFSWAMKKKELMSAFDFMSKEMHNVLEDGDLIGYKEETIIANVYVIMRIKLTPFSSKLVFLQLLFNTKWQEIGAAVADLEGSLTDMEKRYGDSAYDLQTGVNYWIREGKVITHGLYNGAWISVRFGNPILDSESKELLTRNQ